MKPRAEDLMSVWTMGSRPRKLVGHSVIGFSVDTLALDRLFPAQEAAPRFLRFNEQIRLLSWIG